MSAGPWQIPDSEPDIPDICSRKISLIFHISIVNYRKIEKKNYYARSATEKLQELYTCAKFTRNYTSRRKNNILWRAVGPLRALSMPFRPTGPLTFVRFEPFVRWKWWSWLSDSYWYTHRSSNITNVWWPMTIPETLPSGIENIGKRVKRECLF